MALLLAPLDPQSQLQYLQQKDSDGNSALHTAIHSWSKANLVEALLKPFVENDKQTSQTPSCSLVAYCKQRNLKGKTPLHLAAQLHTKHSTKVMATLFKHMTEAADQNAVRDYALMADQKGRIALHYATSRHLTNNAMALLEPFVDDPAAAKDYCATVDNKGHSTLHLIPTDVTLMKLVVAALGDKLVEVLESNYDVYDNKTNNMQQTNLITHIQKHAEKESEACALLLKQYDHFKQPNTVEPPVGTLNEVLNNLKQTPQEKFI